MEKLIKSLNYIKINENKTTINDLNIDCLQEVIKKLKVKKITEIKTIKNLKQRLT